MLTQIQIQVRVQVQVQIQRPKMGPANMFNSASSYKRPKPSFIYTFLSSRAKEINAKHDVRHTVGAGY